MSLVEFYQSFVSNQSIQEVQEAIYTLYEQDDSVLDQWFSIMQEPSLNSLHKFGAISLHCLLTKIWPKIVDHGISPSTLDSFIHILGTISEQGKSNEVLVNNIVYGIEKIFDHIEIDTWPEIIELAFSLSSDPAKASNASIILANCLVYFSTEYLQSIAEPLCGFVQANITDITPQTDINHIARCYRGFSFLLTKDPPVFEEYPEQVTQIFNTILEQYLEFITGGYTRAPGIAIRFADKIGAQIANMLSTSHLIIEPAQFIQAILETFQNESLNIELADSLFMPLKEIIANSPEASKEQFGDLIRLLFVYNEAKYDESQLYEDQDFSIIEVAQAISANITPQEFLEAVISNVNQESAASYFTFLMILDETMENLTEAIEQNPSSIMDPLISLLQESPLPVVQAALSVAKDIAYFVPSVCEEFVNDILQVSHPHLSDEEVETVKYVLDLFSTVFENVNVDTALIANILSDLVQLFESNGEVQPYVMKAIANAVECAQETSIAFFDIISGIVNAAFSSEEESDVQTRAGAIECVGKLLAYCPNVFGDQIDSYLSAILISLSPEEDSEDLKDPYIQQSGLRAMKVILEHQTDGFEFQSIEIVLSTLIGLTLSIFEVLYEQYSQEEDGDAKLDQLKLIIEVQTFALKHSPEKLKQFAHEQEEQTHKQWNFSVILEKSFKLYFEQEEALIPELLKLGAALLIYSPQIEDQIPEFWQEYFEKLISVFDQESDPNTVDDDTVSNWIAVITSALDVIGDLILDKNAYVLEKAPDFFMLAVRTIHRDLPISKCLAEDAFQYEPELIQSAQTVIINFIDTFGASLPLDEFIQASLDITDKVSDHEKCIMFGALSSLPKVIEIPDEIIQFALSVLPLCDFKHSPDPIFFFNQMLQFRAAQIAEHLQQILEHILTVLQQEQVRERYYWETVANSASLLFLFAKAFPSDIDITQYLGIIVNKLPYKGDFIEAHNIIENIIGLFNTSRSAFTNQEIYIPVFDGFVSLCILNDKVYNNYKLTQTNQEGIKAFLHFILQNDSNMAAHLQELLDNELKVQLFSNRSGISLE